MLSFGDWCNLYQVKPVYLLKININIHLSEEKKENKKEKEKTDRQPLPNEILHYDRTAHLQKLFIEKGEELMHL